MKELDTRNEINKLKTELENTPDDISISFKLAQLYEEIGENDLAVVFVKPCINVLPNSVEALALASRCLSSIDLHDEAYQYCKRALSNIGNERIGKFESGVFKFLSYIPGLSKLSKIENTLELAYKKQEKWLVDYAQWYEQRNIT